MSDSNQFMNFYTTTRRKGVKLTLHVNRRTVFSFFEFWCNQDGIAENATSLSTHTRTYLYLPPNVLTCFPVFSDEFQASNKLDHYLSFDDGSNLRCCRAH